MKKIIASIFIIILSSCSVPESKAPAPRAPAVKPAVAAPTTVDVTPNPSFVQPTGEWIDWPISNGNWVYRQDGRGSIALFGSPGQDALLTLRCAKADGQLYFSRAGNPQDGAQLTIRTSHTFKIFSASPSGGSPAYAAAVINPRDDILDALAYTRGRFAVEVNGMQSVAVPSWSEIVRVTEDCR